MRSAGLVPKTSDVWDGSKICAYTWAHENNLTIFKLRSGLLIKGRYIMAYQRKTRDRWDIMTNYGYGWECENSEYTRADARRSLKEYRENCGGTVRLEKHREPVEGYKEKPKLKESQPGIIILNLTGAAFLVLMV